MFFILSYNYNYLKTRYCIKIWVPDTLKSLKSQNNLRRQIVCAIE